MYKDKIKLKTGAEMFPMTHCRTETTKTSEKSLDYVFSYSLSGPLIALNILNWPIRV